MPFDGRWRRALCPGLLLLVFTGCSGSSRSGIDAAPSETASTATTLADVVSAVSEKLEAVQTLVPGVVVAVRLGAATQELAVGEADTRAGRDMVPEDRFQIGSNTKTMVATLVLQLVADGDLGLSDTVDDWLPGLLPRGDRITVDQLLSHRSGLYNFTDSQLDFTRHWQPQDVVEIATRRPQLFPPGTQSSYSNTNYIVLGLLVEKVSGHPVEQLMQTRIFDPAGMSATSLDSRRVAEPPIAHSYDEGTDVTSKDLSLAWTAGAIVSTAGDMTRFHESLFHDELGAGLLTEMATWRGRLADGGLEYGLGLARIPISCGQAWGHNGEISGFASEAWSLPDGTRSVVILVNESGYAAVTAGIIDTALCT